MSQYKSLPSRAGVGDNPDGRDYVDVPGGRRVTDGLQVSSKSPSPFTSLKNLQSSDFT